MGVEAWCDRVTGSGSWGPGWDCDGEGSDGEPRKLIFEKAVARTRKVMVFCSNTECVYHRLYEIINDDDSQN